MVEKSEHEDKNKKLKNNNNLSNFKDFTDDELEHFWNSDKNNPNED